MPKTREPRPTNRILAALPSAEYDHLRDHLLDVRFAQGKVLFEPGDDVSYVYFFNTGMTSLLARARDGKQIEVGLIGNEGAVGAQIILGRKQSTYQCVVQMAGGATKIKAVTLASEFRRAGKLQERLLKSLHALHTQVSQGLLCNRFHTLEERLCRWLLLSRDRVQSADLPLTQEFLSLMLGVNRTGVTLATGALQNAGLISNSRGNIEILDGKALESIVCECYGAIRKEYDALDG